jgi:hypothetical protein
MLIPSRRLADLRKMGDQWANAWLDNIDDKKKAQAVCNAAHRRSVRQMHTICLSNAKNVSLAETGLHLHRLIYIFRSLCLADQGRESVSQLRQDI